MHQFLPASDLSHATCLYEAASLEAVRAFVDGVLGPSSTQRYFAVAEEHAVGLPVGNTPEAGHGTGSSAQESPGYSLLVALLGCRARRFGLCMESPSGPLALRSRHAPMSLSELERAVLIAAATGVTG